MQQRSQRSSAFCHSFAARKAQPKDVYWNLVPEKLHWVQDEAFIVGVPQAAFCAKFGQDPANISTFLHEILFIRPARVLSVM